MYLRKAKERGFYQNDWLKSYHSFSFGEYYDPSFMNFNNLKVINEDFISARKGFSTHTHRNMEILTYVISGSLEHQDSMGNHMILNAGEMQRMSAGSGIMHSELNPMHDQELHMLQIWIEPNVFNISPSYEQIETPIETKINQLHLLASAHPKANAIKIHQDLNIYGGKFTVDHDLELKSEEFADYYIHIMKGHIKLDNKTLSKADAIAIENQHKINLQVGAMSEFLIFEFPKTDLVIM